MSTLGVVVFSFRGMKHLPQCLDSVQWADAVTVWDAAENRRPNLVEETERLSRELKTDWVLHLWGEERVGRELRGELDLVRQVDLGSSPLCHFIPVRSLLLGRWVNGSLWGPSPACRLCRRDVSVLASWWSPQSGAKGTPSGLLHHRIDDFSCAELHDGVDRVNQISSFWAEQLTSEGRSLSAAAIAFRPLRVLLHLLFINGLLFKGLAGLSLSGLAAYATLVGGMKWWEARNA